MDILILLGTMLVSFVIGMPIAYALAMAAIAGALSIGIPLEALMLKISDGVSKVAMLTIPFFVLAGGILAGGGMGRAAGAFPGGAGGVHPVRRGIFHPHWLGAALLRRILRVAVTVTSVLRSL